MKHAKNHDFCRIGRDQLINDNVRCLTDDPFPRSGYASQAACIRKVPKQFGRFLDAVPDAQREVRTGFGSDVIANRNELGLGARAVAQLQRPNFCHTSAISESLAILPSRTSRRASSTSAAWASLN